MTADAELAARLLIVKLSRVGPARSRWLLDQHSAIEVVAALKRRTLPVGEAVAASPKGVTRALVEKWFSEVHQLDGVELLDQHRAAGQVVLGPEDRYWPFADDPEPPVLLFASGHLSALHHTPKVAVIGTRRCTTIGRRVADGFGVELSEGGASVVSGLALGIDGAAHLGALSVDDGPRPIGVVASGLDQVYPATHNELWRQLAERGLLLSEAPLGTAPERWRFPARNRLIAGLSDMVVVVESHHRGGALLTADEAAARDVPVAVVPGSVTSPASTGTNDLLFDGCTPVRASGDVLELLGLSSHSSGSRSRQRAHREEPARQRPTQQQLRLGPAARPSLSRPSLSRPSPGSALHQVVLAEIGAGAVHIDALVAAADRPVAEVMQAVRVLQEQGQVLLDGGWVARP